MGKLRKACANCIKYKLACEAKRPCSRCVLHQCSCIDVERKPRAARKTKRPRLEATAAPELAPSPPPVTKTTLPLSPIVVDPSPSSASSFSSSFIPDLVLNDNEPLYTNNNMDSFMLQSAEASVLPYVDNGFMFNNGFLSSVLFSDPSIVATTNLAPKEAIDAVAVEPHKFEEPLKQTHFQPAAYQANPLHQMMNPMISPSNKLVIPFPQPLIVVNKHSWAVVDCNNEFAQLLGYITIEEFNRMVHDLSDIIMPEAIGIAKQSFEFLLKAKVNHYERLGTLRAKDGAERTVTFYVDVLENLMLLTVREVFDMHPMCFYSRWLKSVAPNTPAACAHSSCQAKNFDFLLPQNQVQQQPHPIQVHQLPLF